MIARHHRARPSRIVGGGPAGLMLSPPAGPGRHRVRGRRRSAPVARSRRPTAPGILEQDSVRLLVDTGVSDRVLRDGYEHEGIDLAFGGGGHRIDFQGPGRRVRPALPPDRRVHRPRRRPRARRRRRAVRRQRRLGRRRHERQPGDPVHRRRRRRPREVRVRLPRRGRRLPQHLPAGVPGVGPRRSTSGSTRSPGSASSARRRRARPS